MIENHNAEQGKHWKAEYNDFALMTTAEKEQYLGANISTFSNEKLVRRNSGKLNLRNVGLPKSANYEKMITPPKGQGKCGSCWAFGASAPLEYQINRRKGGIVTLSEQQWVDCVYDRSGCKGGWMSTAWKWTRDNDQMIAKSSDYPYEAEYGKCKKKGRSALSGMKILEVINLGRDAKDEEVAKAIADKAIGVLATAVAAGKSFFQYKSGVYDEKKCGEKVNHAMVFVGYGIKDGEGFFRLRNSWGGWGDSGHINVRRGMNGKSYNICRTSEFAQFPKLSGGEEKDDEDDKDDHEEDDGNGGGGKWRKLVGKQLKGGMTDMIYSVEEAKEKCEKDDKCKGICCEGNKCELNKKDKYKDDEDSVSYLLNRDGNDDDDDDKDDDKDRDDEDDDGGSGSWKKLVGKQLKGGMTDMIYSLEEAKEKCEKDKNCKGICCEGNKCELNKKEKYKDDKDSISYLLNRDGNDEDEDDDDDDGDRGSVKWKKLVGKQLKGGMTKMEYSLEDAKEKCEKDGKCKGICCEGNKCELNKKDKYKDDKDSVSYLLDRDVKDHKNSGGNRVNDEEKWTKLEGKQLKGGMTDMIYSIEEAKEKCEKDEDCKGICCEGNKCELNKKEKYKDDKDSISYLLNRDGNGEDEDEDNDDEKDRDDEDDDGGSGSWKKLVGKQLKGGMTEMIFSLEEAKERCLKDKNCKGICCEGNKCELNKKEKYKDDKDSVSYLLNRDGNDDDDDDEDEKDDEKDRDDENDDGGSGSWKKLVGKQLKGGMTDMIYSLEEAKEKCVKDEDCKGICCEGNKCELNKKDKYKDDEDSVSYLLNRDGNDNDDDDNDDDKDRDDEDDDGGSGSWKKLVGKQLKGGMTEMIFSLEEAKERCLKDKNCKGICCEGNKCELNKKEKYKDDKDSVSYLLNRDGNDDDDDEDEKDDEKDRDDEDDDGGSGSWKKLVGKQLKGGMTDMIYSLEEAKEKCIKDEDCKGIRCEGNKCELNKKDKYKDDEDSVSYLLNRDGDNEKKNDKDNDEDDDKDKKCKFSKVKGKVLEGSMTKMEYNIVKAMDMCKKDPKCSGITCKNCNGCRCRCRCELNSKEKLKDGKDMVAYVKECGKRE